MPRFLQRIVLFVVLLKVQSLSAGRDPLQRIVGKLSTGRIHGDDALFRADYPFSGNNGSMGAVQAGALDLFSEQHNGSPHNLEVQSLYLIFLHFSSPFSAEHCPKEKKEKKRSCYPSCGGKQALVIAGNGGCLHNPNSGEEHAQQE